MGLIYFAVGLAALFYLLSNINAQGLHDVFVFIALIVGIAFLYKTFISKDKK